MDETEYVRLDENGRPQVHEDLGRIWKGEIEELREQVLGTEGEFATLVVQLVEQGHRPQWVAGILLEAALLLAGSAFEKDVLAGRLYEQLAEDKDVSEVPMEVAFDQAFEKLVEAHGEKSGGQG